MSADWPLALAKCRPSGLKATQFTLLEWPERVHSGVVTFPAGATTSQILMVWSCAALARRVPSWLKATLVTPAVCPRKVSGDLSVMVPAGPVGFQILTVWSSEAL